MLCFSKSSGSYAYTPNAFIFSLRNEESLGPFKSAVTYPPHAIYRSSKSGPVFGAGHDIYIANNANSNVNSYTYFGHYYHVPSGVQDKNTVLMRWRCFILAESYASPDKF